METLISFCVASLAAISAWAQPLPPEVGDSDELARVELRALPVGARVWRAPESHELRWYIAYDATPLTVDNPEFSIRLVNKGRPVRVPRPNSNQLDQFTLSLTFPDGSSKTVSSDDRQNELIVYTSGPDRGLIRTGKPLARLDLRLLQHFGTLPQGVHVLRIDLEIGVTLKRARDGHSISDSFKVALPPLRFEVLDRPIPEHGPADEHEIVIYPETDNDELSGKVRGILTNPLDVPLTLCADTGWDPAWSPTAELPASMYNAIERWTDSGWLRDDSVGYCGTGMGDILVAPSGSLPIALYSPKVHNRVAGVYRCVVAAETPDGETVEFVTAPILVTSRP